jgi:hypothetical protein
MPSFAVTIAYGEFKEYFCEDWGDVYFQQTFDKYVDIDGNVEIEYKYGEYKNGKTQIIYRMEKNGKPRSVRYTSSSHFAMWWCALTDGIEDDAESLPDDLDDHTTGYVMPVVT